MRYFCAKGVKTGSELDMRERYRRRPDIEESPLQGDLMLFDPGRSRFFVLNPTMAFLWRHCDGEKSFDNIINALPVEFADTDVKVIAEEMKTALDELIVLELVTNDEHHERIETL